MRRLPLMACLVGLVVIPGLSTGATIAVTTTEPGRSADGECSLVEAVENANSGSVHMDCEAGDDGVDTIELASSQVYPRPEWSWLVLEDATVIEGHGSSFAPIAGYGSGGIWCRARCTIRDLTVTGFVGAAVFGISEEHTLMLDGCVLARNFTGVDSRGPLIVEHSRVLSNGCGIRAASSTILRDVSIVGNVIGMRLEPPSPGAMLDECRVADNYDGLRGTGGGDLVIRNSVFTANGWKGPVHFVPECALTMVGPGDADRPARLRVVGTSIHGNHYADGVCLRGAVDAVIDRSTLSSNSPSISLADPAETPGTTKLTVRDSTIIDAVGIEVNADDSEPTRRHVQIRINNAVIGSDGTRTGQGTAPSRCRVTEGGASVIEADFVSLGFNLADDDSCGLNHHTDMVEPEVMVAGLADHGGPTPVHMPLPGSHAIDMGDDRCGRVDQRGYRRPADGDGDGVAHCDCGAVEVGAVPPHRDPGGQ